jgi:ATP-dependent Clp protease, protease subunit
MAAAVLKDIHMSVLVNGELLLYGFVGENYWGEGFTAREVLDALTDHGRDEPVTVRINSGGGYVDDGIAIFNALRAHAGKVTVIVDAMAASSASIIAMAGEERIMRTGSMLMIHDPSGGVWGTAADMDAFSKVMEKQAENLASIYAEVTGTDASTIRDDMRTELWLNASEAVERGFATSIESKRAATAAAHDYSIYANAPQRLVALSARHGWTSEQAKISAAASAPAKPGIEKEKPTMANLNAAEHSAAETSRIVAEAVSKTLADSKARIKAISTSEDAKGREARAEHLAHETDMTAEAAIAVLKAAPVTAAAPTPPAVPAPAAQASSYETQRLAAASLAMPGGGGSQASAGPKISASAIFEMRRNAQKGA